MFERKIEETIAFLLKETIADQENITSRQIFASDVPDALKRMFEQDVDIWLKEEEERLQQSPHFRYEDSAVTELFDGILSHARENAVFSREEYVHTLEKNIKLLFNYLCRPQWTLHKYLFADRENASTDDIIDGLRYFWDYEYYPVILREYFSKKDLTVMQERKFSELLGHVDSEIVRSFDSRKLAHLTTPLFNLFSMGSKAEEKFVPVEALSIFFDDKNLSSIVERLDREKEQREQITMHDLVMLISEVDFTMSYDISTIVNQHVHQSDVMKPERNITAGEDFEVPKIVTPEHEEENRREIGEEESDLDFVITDEEDAVVEQHYDSIPSMEDDLLLEEEQDEEGLSDDQQLASDEYEDTVPADAEDDDVVELEDEAYIDNDDHLQDELPSENEEYENAILEEDEELPEIEDYDSTVETILDIEQQLEEQDTIPEMTLEEEESEMEEYSLVEEESDAMGMGDLSGRSSASGDDSSSSFLDELPDLSLDEDEDEVSEETSDDASPEGETSLKLESESTELEIDWDKEVEDIPDVDLEDVEEEEKALPDDSIPGISLENEDQLKPAEELLGELDLDDLDDMKNSSSGGSADRRNDIPIVEDPVDLDSGSDHAAEEKVEAAPSRPAEEVIAEFGDLRQQISAADKKKYVKKLFKKEDDALDRALAALNGKGTWREASEYIDELFIKYDVDMYSRLAVKFTDDVYKRYINEK